VQESRALPTTVGVERVQSNYDSSKINNKQRFPCDDVYYPDFFTVRKPKGGKGSKILSLMEVILGSVSRCSHEPG
jgi:hypothetical protein